ncbi:hypothetical protein [Xenorhabdus littoralis]|uniref:hypothetical protein n=1 Tax=Xenorhabdus littoralis TaxID=2582835 RepID=UPI0029E7D3DC|nr:hypothetical protein [Xenorhabdus sp. psl]
MLASLGQVFAIDDYIWQPLPDGSVYLGSWANSLFAGKPVDIPNEFSKWMTAITVWRPLQITLLVWRKTPMLTWGKS